MHSLFAERFKCARYLNGFSLQDVADNLGNSISKQALHKYEKGEVLPDSKMIERLCELFKVRPNFFFTDTTVEITKVEFRKLDTLPVKEQNQIIEIVKDNVSRYLEVESILALTSEFENPLRDIVEIRSFEDIEAAVNTLREVWNIGDNPIASCLELLEDNNIKVIQIDVEDGFEGMQAWINNTIPIIAINKVNLKAPDRVRFTILHELAHLLLPVRHLPERQKEKFCNQFAASLLISRNAAVKELGAKRTRLMIEELGELKKEYGISIQALTMRARDLGIISKSYCNNFFFMFNQFPDWKINEPISYKGREQSTRFNQLIFRAIAENLISLSKAAVLKNQTVADFRQKSLIIN
jgi:Zn-dependent peptidase ImmA (M78 family)/DNA-binding XRE family transcriptional regulator